MNKPAQSLVAPMTASALSLSGMPTRADVAGPAMPPPRGLVDASTEAAILDALMRFEAWLSRFGETSYDHQSYFAGRAGGAAKALYYRQRLLGTAAVAPMILSEALFPAARQLFHVKQRFPIADAHYAMGFALLAAVTQKREHYQKAVHFLDVLESTRSPGYAHHAWGYPFDWVTRTGVMTAGTPLITTTPYVYEAFGAVHALDGQTRWRDTMASIARHAATDFGDRPLSETSATAGYNPHDRQGNVVNASSYRGYLLTAAARQFDNDAYRATAERNINYVLSAQREDGAWPYATDGVRDFVDHFHTCFVLKALAKIEQLAPSPRLTHAIERGVAYYVEHLFDEHGLPRPFALAPRLTVYRHELYDYAECINLAVLLAGRFAPLDARLRSTVADLLARWRKSDGSFRSRRLMLGWDNVPMHRWAQAQLFRSLCLLLNRSAAPAALARSF
jgi:hypothetical protein